MNDEYEKYGWVDESMQEVCPDCGDFMNYHPDHDIYVCPNCDKEIKLSSEEDYEKYFPMRPAGVIIHSAKTVVRCSMTDI